MLKNNGIIILILIVAAVLRLIFPSQIPFTHDEFSALFRTEFTSFHDLIEFGVKPDGHPALIQIFLFYWVRLFGINELYIKLPFILSGIASVYLIYVLAKKWYNKTVALISAAFMASLQYPVMYSQIARPYISGLFFTMMMVWFWTNLIRKPEYHFWKNALFYIVFSSLCAYNHHFSLLSAFITGITGLFYIKKEYLARYFLVGIVIFLIYIPHLGIFLYQLSTGSIENWLGKPRPGFLIDFFKYIFHFSYFVGILVIVIISGGFLNRKDNSGSVKKYFFISVLWFLIPVIIAYLYSYFIGNVLQYSVLFFCFPFLLFALFSHLPNLKFKSNILLVLIIFSINILSLIFERKHYYLFYNSPFEQILIKTQNAQNRFGKSCISIISSSEKITNYYLKKDNFNPEFFRMDSFRNNRDFIRYLKSQNAEFLSLGCLSNIDPVQINLISDFYPNLINKIDYAGGNFYLFSKQKSKESIYFPTVFKNDFEKISEGWEITNQQFLTRQINYEGNYSCQMDTSQEFGPFFSGDLDQLIRNENDFIDVSVMVYSKDELNDVFIVSSIESKGKLLDWRSSKVDEYFTPDSALLWEKARHSIKFSDIRLNNSQMKLKVFIWNKSRKKFYLDNFEIKVRQGNPVIYGLIEKVW